MSLPLPNALASKDSWFYTLGLPWFDVASNGHKDALRRRSVNVSLHTQCLEVVHVSVEASVSVRRFYPLSVRFEASVCVSRILNAPSLNTTCRSKDDKYRSSFVTESKTTDLFVESAARVSTRRL